MIYLTGDTHGEIDSDKLCIGEFAERTSKQLTKDDYLIILGDFGFIWSEEPDDAETFWMSVLEQSPWTTLFIDGNHENFHRLNNMPIEQWHGGKVHKINDSVIHLMRGQVFEIDDSTFFTFGGALSIDKNRRTEGLSWWKEEQASYQEIEEGFTNLQKHGNKVDYVLTHTCITEVCKTIVRYSNGSYSYPDPMTKVLDHYYSMLDFKKWYFGHWHIDLDCGKVECLYNKIKELEK